MIKITDFGTTPEGRRIKAFTLTNTKGIKATIIERGATLTSLIVPDKDGREADVVLGFDNLEQYLENPPFFGATVGRNANRISDSRITIDGREYELEANEGENNLHTHTKYGFHKRDWEGQADDFNNSVVFFLEEEDGLTGFPGRLEMTVTYRLTEDNELLIAYHGVSDKNTVINCTNHSYFNLAGHASGDIHSQLIRVNASKYVPVVSGAIPTGELDDVEGTPFDLREPIAMGAHIDDDFEQLRLVGGYDHNFCIDGADHKVREAAWAKDPISGREMVVMTDLPGVQLYCGNFIPECTGKEGARYAPRCGFCLETQYYPDSINKDGFESPVFGPDKEYSTSTIYKFI